MFCKSDCNGYREVLPGISMKALVHGERTLMTEFRLKKGSILPSHEHLHEQTGYLVSGRMILSIGNTAYEVISGNSWNIPGGVSHCAEVLEDSVAIEVFSPRRDEYLQ